MIYACMRVLGWTAVGIWAIGTGFEVTAWWRTTAFLVGTTILVSEALLRYRLEKRSNDDSKDDVDDGTAR